MSTTRRNRRRFLKSGAALAGLTVTGVRPALGHSSMTEALSPKNKERFPEALTSRVRSNS